MNSLGGFVGALIAWSIGSVILFGVSAMTINKIVMAVAITIAAGSLLGCLVLYKLGRRKLGFIAAVVPAAVVWILFVVALLFNVALIFA